MRRLVPNGYSEAKKFSHRCNQACRSGELTLSLAEAIRAGRRVGLNGRTLTA
jgi:hypothetical protein